jgi:hypothetical protein
MIITKRSWMGRSLCRLEDNGKSGVTRLGSRKGALLWTALLGLLLFLSDSGTSIAQLLRQIIQTALPVASSGVNGLAVDSASRIWLTLRGRHSLGMISASACATQGAAE